MKRVLFDTNILLDVILARAPHLAASAAALDLVGQGKVDYDPGYDYKRERRSR